MIATLIVLGMLVLTQIVKQFIAPKWGDTGVHIFIGVVALIIVVVQALVTYYPGFGALLLEAGKYLLATVGTYEVILKKFTNPTPSPIVDTTNVSV